MFGRKAKKIRVLEAHIEALTRKDAKARTWVSPEIPAYHAQRGDLWIHPIDGLRILEWQRVYNQDDLV